MIPGGVGREVIAFNDETFWTGGPYNPNSPESFAALFGRTNDTGINLLAPPQRKTPGPEVLAQVRAAALDRRWSEASRLAWGLSSIPEHVQFYQAMGRLNLTYPGHDEARVSDYRRTLDMDNALATTSYTLDGVRYTRTVFASYPDQVIVIRLTADKPGKITANAHFTSLQPSAKTRVTAGGRALVMDGTAISEKRNETILPPKIKWQARVWLLPEGGELVRAADARRAAGSAAEAAALRARASSGGNTPPPVNVLATDAVGGVTRTGDLYEIPPASYPETSPVIGVRAADALTIVLAGATNWKAWNDVTGDANRACADYIDAALRSPYQTLLARHLADYRPLFAACKIYLGPDPAPGSTTTERLQKLRADTAGSDAAYEAQYFQYGRYLLLAAARENTLAFNNHNIWLDNLDGRWRGRWTLNINIQECYWPVETTSLANTNHSLLIFTEQLAAAGERTARELYGFPGWCAHHGTDIWFNTAPTDGNPRHATWPLAGPWLLQQLYEHHLFNPADTAYLKRLYPLLRGSTEFLLHLLVTDPKTGYAVTCPATSPENTFVDPATGKNATVSFGTAGDTQIVRRQLRDFVEAATTLDADPDLRQRAIAALEKLPPHQIGKHGQLQEWFYDFDEPEVTHRHLMNLYALHPDNDISPRLTPRFADASRRVLERRNRGGKFHGNRGWSAAWKINFHARLLDPAGAYREFRSMLADTSIHAAREDSTITPSFEGNQAIQGLTAGVAEMLLQSQHGELELLPALPDAWAPAGSITGLRARGGITLDLSWRNAQLATARLTLDKAAAGSAGAAGTPRILKIRVAGPASVFAGSEKIATKTAAEDLLVFPVAAGTTYTITGGAAATIGSADFQVGLAEMRR
jgi:alpha-L-fucosidase 2